MKQQKRFIAWIMCIGMILVLFVSSAYIAHETVHDCVGEHCEICENIAQMEALLQSFVLLGVVMTLLFTLLTFLRVLRAEEEMRASLSPTLVGWKVRLNH